MADGADGLPRRRAGAAAGGRARAGGGGGARGRAAEAAEGAVGAGGGGAGCCWAAAGSPSGANDAGPGRPRTRRPQRRGGGRRCWARPRRRCRPVTRPRLRSPWTRPGSAPPRAGPRRKATRLERLDADLALLRDLDAADQFFWTWSTTIPGPGGRGDADTGSAGAVRADPDAVSVDEAAARVTTSVVESGSCRPWIAVGAGETTGVSAMLRRMDDDPPYRNKVRDAILAR